MYCYKTNIFNQKSYLETKLYISLVYPSRNMS